MSNKSDFKQTTLVFVFREPGEVLMIEKKRGMGAGKWNVPGGKIQSDETAEAAAIRETFEETGLRVSGLRRVGLLEFHFPENSKSWGNRCQVFSCRDFKGTLLGESEECSSFWWPVAKIPYDRLWPDDRFWLPQLLAGKTFYRIYHFDDKDQLLREEIRDSDFENELRVE